jgi:tetratricopeptide (TPR) repeat protein
MDQLTTDNNTEFDNIELDNDEFKNNELDTHLERYKTLYDQGRFKDILTDGEKYFGPPDQWQDVRLQLLFARCMGHLGMGRSADARILCSWRNHQRNPQHKPQHSPELASFYLGVCRRRRGPLIAWQESNNLLKMPDLSHKEKAHLLCDQIDIVCEFRDFALAEQLLLQAGNLHLDPWVELQQSYLLLAQDNYQEALSHTLSIQQKSPGYRPALQLLAHLYQLTDKLNQAIDILVPHYSVMQSYSLCLQLFNLAIDAKNYELAQRCYDRIESIVIAKPKYLKKALNTIKADLLCAQQRYEQAIPLLEPKNPFQLAISESIKKVHGQAQRKVLDVPFIRQHHVTCAPASLTSVAKYWGKHYQQADVIEAICYDGTPAVDERRWIIEQGFLCIEFELRVDTLKTLIDHDVPVLLATVDPGNAHLQVVVGYDESMGTYLIRDPYYPRLQEMLTESSAQYYASSGPRCVVMLPAAQSALLDNIHFEAKTLYDKYHTLSAALDKHQRSTAFTAYREMLALDTQHRLTIWACRDLAFYDKDEQLILKNTDILLQRYPQDVNLQLSKIRSLSMLTSAQQTLEYQEELYQQSDCHYLISSRLADDLRFNHRQQTRVEKMLRSVLIKNPTHTPTLYAYAGVLWDQKRLEDSFTLYRFITCLEDKNEQYATSYFKAARHHKQENIALEFLIDRHNRFATRSSGPTISLFNALENLDRPEQGLSYLEQALQLRPNDGDLMLYTASRYLQYAKLESCNTLLEKAKPLTNEIRYLELKAEVCEFQQDREQAVSCWKKVLDYEPLNPDANNTLVRLLIESGQRESADQFIDGQLKRFAGNYNMLRVKINSLDDNHYAEHVDVYKTLIDHHPDENWAYIGLANNLLVLGQLDTALHYAKEATSIDANDPAAFTALADVYAAKHMNKEARQYYRQAIQSACDHTSAFEPLLQCALDHDNEKEELAFIHQQLMDQISFGDGILHYQQLAARWLNAGEINQFLQQAVQERPDLWQSWVAQAQGFIDQGSLDKASDTLEKAHKRFPLIVQIFYEKAELFRLMNNLPRAQQALKQALELAPGWVKAANKLADILEIQGKFDQASQCIQAVISRAPLESSPYGYLASLTWRNGEKQTAIEQLCKALELNPLYEWAWTELKQWCDETQQQPLFADRIHAARKNLPDHERLLRVHARLEDTPADSCKLLQEFLNKHPHSVDVCIDYIHRLVEIGDYTAALSICDEQYWDANIPVPIEANKAWVLNERGEQLEAIELMRSVVTKNPNYYDGWRFLANWYEERSNSISVVECVEHCRQLYPNDSSVLCFVAEKLQQHDSSQDPLVAQLYKRAFSLNPTDRYIGLSYIDYLLIDEKPKPQQRVRARAAIDLLKLHVNDAYVYYRELQLAVLDQDVKQDVEQALTLWQAIILDIEANDWLVRNSWDLLDKIHARSKAVTLTHSLQNDHQRISPYVGEYFAYYYIEADGLKEFEKQLISAESGDAKSSPQYYANSTPQYYANSTPQYYDRMLEGYLRHSISEQRLIPKKLDTKIRPRLAADSTNWGLFGYLLVMQDHWYDAIQWLQGYKQREGVEGWVLYFCSLAYRQNGNWQQGVDVMRDAYQLAPDNYREDIVIWHSLDNLFAGKAIDVSQIKAIDQDSIADTTRYPMAIIKTLYTLSDSHFEEKYEQISPLLRECQREFQTVMGLSLGLIPRNMLRDRLKNGLNPLPWVKRVFWHWRLSNHF